MCGMITKTDAFYTAKNPSGSKYFSSEQRLVQFAKIVF